jgi:ribonuclease Z
VHFAFLGTSGALPSLRRDTTSLVFVGRDESILVDCGGSPIQKLLLAAVDPATLAHVVITHIHADHAYGLPALIQGLKVLERRAPLTVSCREEHVEPLRSVLGAFDLLDRADMFPVVVAGVPARPRAPVATTASFAVSASPNVHGRMPNLALRLDLAGRDHAVVYSSDTEPCDAVVELARGAATLVHEATFGIGEAARTGAHSSAGEAGDVAARAGVRRLILTHLDQRRVGDPGALVEAARARFAGEIEIAEELVPYPL